MAQLGGAGPISPSDSVSSEVRAEELWRETGECLALSKFNEKVIEQKEQQLKESIQRNYSKLKGVEKELEGLQLQLRLTSGPKKSALELLRKKIESQNERVVASRSKFAAAKKFMLAAEKELKDAEAVKAQLCSELNLLVHQSTHTQLAKLEQLSLQLEGLEAASRKEEPQGEDSRPPRVGLPLSKSANGLECYGVHDSFSPPRPAASVCTHPLVGGLQQNSCRSQSLDQQPSEKECRKSEPDQIDPCNLPLRAPRGLSPIRTSMPAAPRAGRRNITIPVSRPPGRPSPMRPVQGSGALNQTQKTSPSAGFKGSNL